MSNGEYRRKSVYVSKRLGKVKVKTLVYIDTDLFERVAAIAPKVFGVQRGALSYAVEDALRLWLQVHTQAHRALNPSLNLREKYNAVIDCIESEMGFVPVSVPQSIFEACIRKTLGVKTDRTVHEYLHSFHQAGFVKPLTIERPTKPSDWKKNRSIELVARKA